MKKTNKSLWGIGLSLLILTGCFVDDSVDPVPPDNGNAIIHGQVKHHDDAIPHAKVYLKIHASEFPGDNTAIYTDSTVANEVGFYTFTNLYQARYYIYSIGYDSNFSETVKGGVPVIIDAPGKELTTNIPVTE